MSLICVFRCFKHHRQYVFMLYKLYLLGTMWVLLICSFLLQWYRNWVVLSGYMENWELVEKRSQNSLKLMESHWNINGAKLKQIIELGIYLWIIAESSIVPVQNSSQIRMLMKFLCKWHVNGITTSQNHTMTEWLRLEGTFGGELVQLLLNQAKKKKTTKLDIQTISKDGDSTIALANLCHCLNTAWSPSL